LVDLVSHLTLRGSGRAQIFGAEFKVICRRCTSPLAFHALGTVRVKEIRFADEYLCLLKI
jgi:hypothetical protein